MAKAEQTEGRLAIKVLGYLAGGAMLLAAGAFGWAWNMNRDFAVMRSDLQKEQEERKWQTDRAWDFDRWAYAQVNKLRTKNGLEVEEWPK